MAKFIFERPNAQSIEFGLSRELIESVLSDFERDNPGRTHLAMNSDEFSNRVMAKFVKSGKIVTS